VQVVLATGMPIMNRSLHFSVLSPMMSHCVAVRVKKSNRQLHNMYVNCDQPMRSLRATGASPGWCGW